MVKPLNRSKERKWSNLMIMDTLDAEQNRAVICRAVKQVTRQVTRQVTCQVTRQVTCQVTRQVSRARAARSPRLDAAGAHLHCIMPRPPEPHSRVTVRSRPHVHGTVLGLGSRRGIANRPRPAAQAWSRRSTAAVLGPGAEATRAGGT